tara:strand:+ start:516 stop:725 length:210 start_codon:yes stop_codon:yes gene_type:complete
MQSITIYEVGMRSPNGEYSKFCESPDKSKVDDHLEIMKKCTPDGFEVVFLEKVYHCVSTTPHIIKSEIN